MLQIELASYKHPKLRIFVDAKGSGIVFVPNSPFSTNYSFLNGAAAVKPEYNSLLA